jgi:acetyl-CoA C-acetyltransferase
MARRKLMRDVCIVGSGMTKLGSVGSTPEIMNMTACELFTWAAHDALREAKCSPKEIEYLYLGNETGHLNENQGMLDGSVSRWAGLRLGETGPGGVRMESACSPSYHALQEGVFAIASGMYDIVMCGGVEIVTMEVHRRYPGSLDDIEVLERNRRITSSYDAGWFRPQLDDTGSNMAIRMLAYGDKYGLSREQVRDTLDAFCMSDCFNGARNPLAHYPFEVSHFAREAGFDDPKAFLDDLEQNPYIVYPLRRLDYATTSDGAAVHILCSKEKARQFTDQPIKILGLANRYGYTHTRDMTSIPQLVEASKIAYDMAGVGPDDVDTLEVHTCYTPVGFIGTEDLGYFKRGEAWKAYLEGRTTFKGDKPVNTSGGSRARGNPTGALFVCKVFELMQQLRGRAGARQVQPQPKVGMAYQIGAGGDFSTMVMILGRGY